MSQSQVISFRVSGHFLNWIEAQKLDGESVNQAAQRILKEISGVYGDYKLYITSGNAVSTTSADLSTTSADLSTTSADLSTTSADLSTTSADLSTASTRSIVSTNTVDIVDKAVAVSLDPVMERMAAIEERLGKLRA